MAQATCFAIAPEVTRKIILGPHHWTRSPLALGVPEKLLTRLDCLSEYSHLCASVPGSLLHHGVTSNLYRAMVSALLAFVRFLADIGGEHHEHGV
jgi:hypothetical protein